MGHGGGKRGWTALFAHSDSVSGLDLGHIMTGIIDIYGFSVILFNFIILLRKNRKFADFFGRGNDLYGKTGNFYGKIGNWFF
jgi:hypothetical protein